jgi:uncharacterized RDD family membrane protein YckC
MASAIGFETPENVEIQYQPAGLGHRYIAWLVDQILVLIVAVFLVVGTITAGVMLGGVIEEALESLGEEFEEAATNDETGQQIVYIVVGLAVLVWSLSNFVYFICCELLLRGQTVGKRVIGIRVVKANGFSLDPISIFVRNIFRLIDQFSPLWIVPVLSRRSQRLGDMVAGTVVVFDKPERLSLVREELAGRAAADVRFRFDAAALARLRPVDFETVELLLDRWDDIKQSQLVQFLDTMLDPLAQRLRVDSPAPADRLAFLEDLLAAEYRRQSRSLA